MVLSRYARDCVVFLGKESESGFVPQGTGFLLEGGRKLGGGHYLVTAGHVARQLLSPAVVRLNKKEGGVDLWPCNLDWTYPDDHGPPEPLVDLAVVPFEAPEWADIRYFSADHALYPGKLEEKDVGVGDSAYVVGLYYLVHGKSRNLPIVLTGNIAMMPGDELIPVRDTDGKERAVQGYLVESSAISGCSGAPVFVRPERPVRTVPLQDGTELKAWASGTLWLLGVWQSSWKVLARDIAATFTVDQGADKTAPLGMGAVVPFEKLWDLLQTDKLRTARAAKRPSVPIYAKLAEGTSTLHVTVSALSADDDRPFIVRGNDEWPKV